MPFNRPVPLPVEASILHVINVPYTHLTQDRRWSCEGPAIVGSFVRSFVIAGRDPAYSGPQHGDGL